MNQTYVLQGRLHAISGKGGQLTTLLQRAAKILKNVKGCKLYLISRVPLEFDTIFVTEVWDSKFDHDQSLSQPELREIIEQAMPLLKGSPELNVELEYLGGL